MADAEIERLRAVLAHIEKNDRRWVGTYIKHRVPGEWATLAHAALAISDPTPEMLERGARVLRTNATTTDDEIRAHDLWQAMYDEFLASNSHSEVLG